MKIQKELGKQSNSNKQKIQEIFSVTVSIILITVNDNEKILTLRFSMELEYYKPGIVVCLGAILHTLLNVPHGHSLVCALRRPRQMKLYIDIARINSEYFPPLPPFFV